MVVIVVVVGKFGNECMLVTITVEVWEMNGNQAFEMNKFVFLKKKIVFFK